MADEEHRPGGGNGGTGAALARKLVGPAIIAVAVLLFVVQNPDENQFSYLVFDFSAPLWLMLAVTALLGVIIGWFLGRRSKS